MVPPDKEKRRHKRAVSTATVTYRVRSPIEVSAQYAGRPLQAVAQDIGEGGMGLLSNHDLPNGATLMLSFKLLNDRSATNLHRQREFDLSGEVRYCSAADNGCYRQGVRFLNATEDDREFIAVYVRDQRLSPF